MRQVPLAWRGSAFSLHVLLRALTHAHLLTPICRKREELAPAKAAPQQRPAKVRRRRRLRLLPAAPCGRAPPAACST